jgi:hypothetical protein
LAAGATGSFTRSLDSGQQEAHENSNNSDHNKKFDERKTRRVAGLARPATKLNQSRHEIILCLDAEAATAQQSSDAACRMPGGYGV